MTAGKAGRASDGSSATNQTVFLERRSYRRRRLMDIARLLSLFGVVLLLVPLFWPGNDPAAVADGTGAAKPMSEAIIYVFTVWAILIAGAGLFAVAARRWGEDGRQSDPGRD